MAPIKTSLSSRSIYHFSRLFMPGCSSHGSKNVFFLNYHQKGLRLYACPSAKGSQHAHSRESMKITSRAFALSWSCISACIHDYIPCLMLFLHAARRLFLFFSNYLQRTECGLRVRMSAHNAYKRIYTNIHTTFHPCRCQQLSRSAASNSDPEHVSDRHPPGGC